MDEYKFWIDQQVNYKDRWIYIETNDEMVMEEPDSFCYMMKNIQNKIGGKIIDLGDAQYLFSADALGLIFQWDGCFGITVIYPRNCSVEKVISFLEKLLSEEHKTEK